MTLQAPQPLDGSMIVAVVDDRWRAALAYALERGLAEPSPVCLLCGLDTPVVPLHAPVPLVHARSAAAAALLEHSPRARLIVHEQPSRDSDGGWWAMVERLHREAGCEVVEVDPEVLVRRVSHPGPAGRRAG